jgi:DNA polymerase-3 subunit epsilon
MGVSWGRVLVLMPTEGYAVVDLETTGLHPGYEHRIVEIGVVQLDESGEVLDEWSTLLNPDRDLGAQHIHGIRAADVLQAPRFADVAAHIGQLLQGRVLVAHNLVFDSAHLLAEYERLGVAAPISAASGVCTMRWASKLFPGMGRSLANCCDYLGVDLSEAEAHAAVPDARASAGLLRAYFQHMGAPPPWQSLFPITAVWPTLTVRPFRVGGRCGDLGRAS